MPWALSLWEPVSPLFQPHTILYRANGKLQLGPTRALRRRAARARATGRTLREKRPQRTGDTCAQPRPGAARYCFKTPSARGTPPGPSAASLRACPGRGRAAASWGPQRPALIWREGPARPGGHSSRAEQQKPLAAAPPGSFPAEPPWQLPQAGTLRAPKTIFSQRKPTYTKFPEPHSVSNSADVLIFNELISMICP